MNRIAARCRDSVRRKLARALRPALEGLEDRKLLATVTGGYWTRPGRISYSFMPDGTSIGGVPSNLFQKLDAIAPTATWQAQFQKAAALWQQVTGINLALVPDNGDPLGGIGKQQGDARYGDIRIGGNAMDMSLLGFSLLPPPYNGGPDAGDIVINTSQPWKINSDYDLLTVAIHEIGHSLGMGHSTIHAAQMFAYYNVIKPSLTSDDIAGIQSIYGPIPAEQLNNTTFSTAMDLTSMLDPQGRATFNAGYVRQASDYEWFKVTVPTSTTGTMIIKMQSSSLSSLSPRLTILTPTMGFAGAALGTNQYGTTIATVTEGVEPGQVYYIRASSAQPQAGSNGAFALLVNFGTGPLSPALPYTNPVVEQQPDMGSGGGSYESTSMEIQPNQRRIQRRIQLRIQRQIQRIYENGHTNGPDQSGHSLHVITLDNGDQAYADFLSVGPRRRHPHPPRFRRA